MATQKMYASGLICSVVCAECEHKPCPHKTWLAKNTCQKLIGYNEKLGHCCATCLHLVAEKYCGEMASEKKIDSRTNFRQFLIDDIFAHTCDKWTNEYEE